MGVPKLGFEKNLSRRSRHAPKYCTITPAVIHQTARLALEGGLHWPGYGNLRTVADPLSRTTTYSLR